ncbi:hypothetical protein [Streptococcus equi]|uniref:hypothetical protein n=1 Tax=Streptococcus equi TaxID=1336 RepID=UPI001E50445A|nr:hypothetical protein [Streptococcus equi]
MVKYAPRKVYIRESGGYVELSYTEFCRCRESDQTYMDKLFIPIQGCLLEVVREQYTDFYRDKERWRYLQKLDTKNRLLSLDGFTDSEGNPLDFITDEAVDIAETVVNPPIIDEEIFEKARLEKQKRAEKLGRIWEPKDVPKTDYPVKFKAKPLVQKYDDPYKQAEYAYSLIESEV